MNNTNPQTQPEYRRLGGTSASNAQADSLCPGRHNEQKGIPDDKGLDAMFGRKIHDALAKNDPSNLNEEERDIYDRCRQIETQMVSSFFGPDANSDGMKIIVEQPLWVKVPPKQWIHGATPDKIYRLGLRGLIIEYKTLSGDVPEPSTNLQLRDQAVLSKGALMLNEIGVVVAQPLVTMKPTICLYSQEHLAQAEREMFARVGASNNPDAIRVPGELQCKFCRARLQCSEYQRWAGGMVPAMLSILEVPVKEWSPEQRAFFCDRRPVAQKWLDEATKAVQECLTNDPESVPGWMLKPGAIRREITDAQEAFNRFNSIGGTPEQFMGCIKVGKSKFEEAVKAVTGEVGKGLQHRVAGLLEGITEEHQNAPSLAKKKG